jgi:hypothetical protein
MLAFELLGGLQVGRDVVADRGVRAAAGADRADPVAGQHPGPAEEVGVLGGVDVAGDHRQRHLLRTLLAVPGR